MSDHTKIIVRNAREQDIPAVVAINVEAFSPYGTAERPETFQHRLTAFPNGFFIVVAENEIAAYACSEKWLAEREPGLNENALITHQPDGRVLGITGLAAKKEYQGRGYRLLLLDKLIEIAHLEGCKKLVVETMQAQDLYLQRGFQVVQNRSQAGRSVDVMSLDLKPTRMQV